MIVERGTTDALRVLGYHGVYLLPDAGIRQPVLKVQRLADGLEFCQFAWRLRGGPGEITRAIMDAATLPADKMLEAFLDQQGAMAL